MGKITRICRLCFNACEKPLEVIDRAQRLAQFPPQHRFFDQLRDGIEPRVDAVRGEKRMLQPRFQETCPHRRTREVEYIKECIFLAAVAQTARDLKVAQRIGVELHRPRPIEEGETVDL